MRLARAAAGAGWALGVALCIIGAVFAAWQGEVAATVAALTGAAVPTTGAIVARHVPRNPVGWSQLAGGLLGAGGTVGVQYAPLALAHGWTPWWAHLADWFAGWAWLPALASALVFTALWFPDGRVVARPWRAVPWVGVAATVVFAVGLGTASWPIPLAGFVNDAATPAAGPFLVAAMIGVITVAVISLAALAGLVVRWRRADVVGRAQLKWVASALALVVAFITTSEFVDLGSWQNTLGTLSLDAVAVAMGVAVLRYRLYEIDRIVSRTVAYVVVLALLAGVYAGVVLGVGAVLPARLGSLGVALATLTVAVLFLPLTRRVRHGVDRRFHRGRIDRERLVAGYAERVRRDLSPEVAGRDLVGVVARAVEPVHAGLWVAPR